ncbi:MAG TPA: 23S rRNA (pseudouridine(1915)-N(3))-methyltransferase RlmH [Gemmatimonadaceae bacterium]|nr:23S rRNA (pseudouridine(1915)-N(3))-methyltransferase RlmH [Gemmatimonadaceae bacterium]
MRIVLSVIGKPRDAGLAAVIRGYEERARRYWPLEVNEVREESARSSSPELVRKREGERLLDAGGPSPGAHTIACDAGGKRLTSEEFAAWLQSLRESGRDVCFYVGGAFGLSPDLLGGMRSRLSLAPWTLPHELARLVLTEQIYRAGTIVRGEPYHK